ncbi:MAG: hypothetical protein ACPGOV_14965 [Magnetovibrionaceae bacterium]
MTEPRSLKTALVAHTILAGVLFSAVLWVHPSMAQDYKAWSDPDAPQSPSPTQAQTFSKELNALVDKAEKARAADPTFLKDLRALADRYGMAAPVASDRASTQSAGPVLAETFTDGDFTANPTWTPETGKWWVEKGYGLRSEQAAAAGAAEPQEKRKLSGEQLAITVLGAVLGGGRQQQAEPQAEASQPVEATIRLDQTIPNAFDLTAGLTSWQGKGAWSLAVFQGQGRNGYQLQYEPGRSVQLIRIGSSGVQIIGASANRIALEDNKPHEVTWSRGRDGAMTIALDNQQILSVADQGFRDAFSGVRISGSGGSDVVLSSLTVR